jgi:hypothetical protein
MPQRFVLDRWLEYLKALREDLSIQTISEARDAFYGGMIAAFSIMETEGPQAKEAVMSECDEYLAMLRARLDDLERRDSHGTN